MTIAPRRGRERGQTRLDWLESYHTFSFGGYDDPRHMGFGTLRVLNDDRVAPGQGFGTHAHRDMEIITYVLDGALEHRDSLGTGSVIRHGDVQRMSAGTGIRHSEFNPSPSEPVHFLQIWIFPEREGLPPSYEERKFADTPGDGGLRLLASRDARDGSLTIHQDVDLFAAKLGPGQTVAHNFKPGRRGWLHVAAGEVEVAGQKLAEGDGAAIEHEERIEIAATNAAEILLFDLA